MKIVFLITVFIIVVVTFFLFRASFTTPEQSFLEILNPLLKKINDLINSEDYQKISTVIPGQTLLKLNEHNGITKTITTDKTHELDKSLVPIVLDKANKLSGLFNTIIETVNNSTGVYTDLQKKAFITYYTTLLGNNQIVIDYINNLL